jgi:pantothenate kinase
MTFFAETDTHFKEEDLARSLLLSTSNDIGQIAYLQAKLHNLNKIYFGGYFIRGHPITMHTITYAINYWSKVINVTSTFREEFVSTSCQKSPTEIK